MYELNPGLERSHETALHLSLRKLRAGEGEEGKTREEGTDGEKEGESGETQQAHAPAMLILFRDPHGPERAQVCVCVCVFRTASVVVHANNDQS